MKNPTKNSPQRKLRAVWVDDGARTHDTRNHNPMLYRLNYIHHVGTAKLRIFSRFPKIILDIGIFKEILDYNSYICEYA